MERSGKKLFSGRQTMYVRFPKPLLLSSYSPVMPMMTEESTYAHAVNVVCREKAYRVTDSSRVPVRPWQGVRSRASGLQKSLGRKLTGKGVRAWTATVVFEPNIIWSLPMSHLEPSDTKISLGFLPTCA